jgi:hypothetical protein
MRKLLSVLFVSLLGLSSFLPTSALAASKEIYYPVVGASKTTPGIYKAVPNKTGKAVTKEKVYKLKGLSKNPLKLEDITVFYGKDRVAKSSEMKYPWGVNLDTIQEVKISGKDIYFTKFLYATEYAGGCGGGGADILELYKRNSKGKITKVITDKISADATNQFVISGSSLYYSKITNGVFGNFTIIKASLDGKKKTTLQKGVDDFWVSGKFIYFTKGNYEGEKLYRMDLNGKSVKTITAVKAKLYGMNGCGEGNYTPSKNGVAFQDYNEDSVENNYFYDFSTNKVTKMPKKDVYIHILDVNVSKKRIIGMTYSNDNDSWFIGLYDFNGKKIKTLKSSKTPSWFYNFITIDAKAGKFLYTEGNRLKEIKF